MGNRPFLLRPVGKDYLWGGNRLNEDFQKNIDMSPLAETWECSTHPDGLSVVGSGEYTGESLAEVLRLHPEYLGSHPASNGELPILIKFIDAYQDLSVQVHPTDEYAMVHENGQSGKTEMWYVLDAAEDAKLTYGLKHDTQPRALRDAIEKGSLEKYLQRVSVQKDDVFFIEAGTIHAIGAGALIVEIQENSNLTYRLFDYGRVDKDGNRRPLHVDKALDVANLKRASSPRQPMRILRHRPGMASELLCRCKYFEVHRMLINTEQSRAIDYRADALSFRVLLCVNGCGTIAYEEEHLDICKGDCVFVPAESVDLQIYGNAQFLDVRG